MKKIKILISGINGYLARNLANYLVANEEFEVFGFGRNTYKHEDLKSEISIIAIENLESFIQNKGIEIIIHSATNYGRSDCSVESILETNLLLGIRLYTIARENKVPYFINIDTILPKNYSEYALSKKHFVEWAKQLQTSKRFVNDKLNFNDFKFINIELEHFYGLGAPKSNFVSWLIYKLRENVQNIELTECTQRREFLHISDVVSALKTIIFSLDELKSFESITVGTGNPIVLKELIFLAKDIFESKSTFDFGAIPLELNQSNLNFYNHSRIYSLGWKPIISLETGLNTIKNNLHE